MELIQKIEEMLLPLLVDTDIFVVSIKVKPANNIKIFLDADDGFDVSKSTKINKRLRRMIDEEGMFPEGDYSLEVSSPGIDEPLQFRRQYLKNIGRSIEITPNEGEAVTGKLTEVNEDQLTLEIPAAKKKDATPTILSIPFEQIKQAIIQISF
jgi:ribosome maturation factor RimP